MIGVFDSGHGGLTVLRSFVDQLPAESFIYFGDHAAAPYGPRPSAEIVDLTRQAVDHLFIQGCRLVVLACNTASAVSLRSLQQDWLPKAWPGRRILGVLVPTVEAITNVPWHIQRVPLLAEQRPRTVGIFATQRTVDSNAYVEEVRKRAPSIRILQQPCPELAAMIEAGADPIIVHPAIAGYIADLMAKLNGDNLEAVILGCTHYPLVAPIFRDILPADTILLSQPAVTARGLKAYLHRRPEFRSTQKSSRKFMTTGDPQRVSALASRFFGEQVEFKAVTDSYKIAL